MGAGGVNASSTHGNLLGLTSDDHKQYLLADGSRTMGGFLNMGNNAIISAGTINNVTIQSHADRHKNGGSDEIATFTPTASAIPKADTSGKLDTWISNATGSVKGLSKLSVDPESIINPIAVGINDPRYLQSITGVTTSEGSVISNGLTATTISATTYQNVDHNKLLTLQGGLPNEYYHLTASQRDRVLSLIYLNNTVSFSVSPTTGERGLATTLNLTYTVTPKDDTVNTATINPGSYNILSNVDGLPHSQSVGNFSITTGHTLNLGYTRNGLTSASTNTATYTAYPPQWNGISSTSSLATSTYAAVTALGLTKVIQSSTVQTSAMTATNQYLWFISTNSNAAITSTGLPNTIGLVNTEDGVSEWYKKTLTLTLADGVTTSNLYTYRTRELKIITPAITYQIT